MSLLLKEDRIEITIPNSEASINAQHLGIKDRTVGSYYMSDAYMDVKKFLNDFKGYYYIDFSKTYFNMNVLYDYIDSVEKIDLFKSLLINQYTIMNEIEEMMNNNKDTLIKINNPTVNENEKYLKLGEKDDIYTKMFVDLLLGDLSIITIRKISRDCFVIYGSYVKEYKDKIDGNFPTN